MSIVMNGLFNRQLNDIVIAIYCIFTVCLSLFYYKSYEWFESYLCNEIAI